MGNPRWSPGAQRQDRRRGGRRQRTADLRQAVRCAEVPPPGDPGAPPQPMHELQWTLVCDMEYTVRRPGCGCCWQRSLWRRHGNVLIPCSVPAHGLWGGHWRRADFIAARARGCQGACLRPASQCGSLAQFIGALHWRTSQAGNYPPLVKMPTLACVGIAVSNMEAPSLNCWAGQAEWQDTATHSLGCSCHTAYSRLFATGSLVYTRRIGLASTFHRKPIQSDAHIFLTCGVGRHVDEAPPVPAWYAHGAGPMWCRSR